MADSGPQPVDASSRQLHLDIAAGLHLRRGAVCIAAVQAATTSGAETSTSTGDTSARLCRWRQCVMEKLIDGVRGPTCAARPRLRTGRSGRRRAREAAEPIVIRVLVVNQSGCQHRRWTQPADHAGKEDRVGGLLLHFGRRRRALAALACGPDALAPSWHSRTRSSVCRGWPTRQREHMTTCPLSPCASLQSNDPAAAEFDIVGRVRKATRGAGSGRGDST